MKKRFTIATLCAGAAIVPAWAQFGFGITVYDPTNWAELVKQLTQLQQQYEQLVQTYTMVTNQYNQMLTNATIITSKARWKALLTPWTFPAATNTYGTTEGWIDALNTGSGALAGYSEAV